MTLPLTCPCCHHPLTETQIKALWGAYCNSKRVTPPKAGPGRPKKLRPTVIQTGCQHCDQDIENIHPFTNGEWRDRGGNTTCPTPEGDYLGQKHEPYRSTEGLD